MRNEKTGEGSVPEMSALQECVRRPYEREQAREGGTYVVRASELVGKQGGRVCLCFDVLARGGARAGAGRRTTTGMRGSREEDTIR